MKKGLVYIVGAGPGDPGLITVKARAAIMSAEVVVYDRLINNEILGYAPENAELIYVGKSTQHHVASQDTINEVLVEKALENKTVVRLKGGDPFVFGRGGEEIACLSQRGIAFEYIPGITSAVAVPGYAGIPVTHRTCASSVSFITGHHRDGTDLSSVEWEHVAGMPGTLVFVMGVSNLPVIVDRLISCGKSSHTPAALVQKGTTPFQHTIQADLGTISDRAREEHCRPPAVLIVGEVVSLRDTIRWFDSKPLFAKTVLITRPKHQSGAAADMIRALGAEPVLMPVIDIKPVYDEAHMRRTFKELRNYDWVVFTSENAVDIFFNECVRAEADARAFGQSRVCAIGPKTAESLKHRGIYPDCVPSRYCAEGILEVLGPLVKKGQKVLLPRAGGARDLIKNELSQRGVQVDETILYEAVPAALDAEAVRSCLDSDIDYITFTSSSTVRAFMEIAGNERVQHLKSCSVAACIGPITAEIVCDYGFSNIIVAEEYTISGLVSTIAAHAGAH